MVVLLNCSNRGLSSNSQYFLELLKENLKCETEIIQLNQMKDLNLIKEKFQNAEAIVFAMPLYVDSVPAQVMYLMEQLYNDRMEFYYNKKVYVIAGMGFYESAQIAILLEIMKNWCKKMNMIYGGGLAIGAGEMMAGFKGIPLNQGPCKMFGEGIRRMANSIESDGTMEDYYSQPNGIPRSIYMFMANRSWVVSAKKNGIKRKEIKYKRRGEMI